MSHSGLTRTECSNALTSGQAPASGRRSVASILSPPGLRSRRARPTAGGLNLAAPTSSAAWLATSCIARSASPRAVLQAYAPGPPVEPAKTAGHTGTGRVRRCGRDPVHPPIERCRQLTSRRRHGSCTSSFFLSQQPCIEVYFYNTQINNYESIYATLLGFGD